jgi:coenzyme F420-reducing hydrogenase delta subunit
MANNFEPQIVAFLCNWCSYAGADMAGISRIQYPPNIRVVRVMCSGRVDPVFILRAFLCGFDGVLVLGCHPGDCHYLTGNYHAERKMNRLKKLLEVVGMATERLYLDWVSAAEGARFSQIVDSFTERIRQEGPLDKDHSLLQRLHAAELTVQNERVRWLLGSELDLVEEGNVYGEKIPIEELDAVTDEVITDEFSKSWLTLILEEKPVSVREMTAITGLSVETISSYLTELEEAGEVYLHGFEGRAAKYIKRQVGG